MRTVAVVGLVEILLQGKIKISGLGAKAYSSRGERNFSISHTLSLYLLLDTKVNEEDPKVLYNTSISPKPGVGK